MPGKKRRQFARQRLRLAESQGWLCYYCKRKMEPVNSKSVLRLTMEHLHPRGSPGRRPFASGTRAAACFECNNSRGWQHLETMRAQRLAVALSAAQSTTKPKWFSALSAVCGLWTTIRQWRRVSK